MRKDVVIYMDVLPTVMYSRVVSVLDQAQKARVQIAAATLSGNTVLSKLFTPTVPLFTKQQNW